jgi:hypothetical protein
MSEADDVDQVDPGDVELTEAFLGYSVLVKGERVGPIEGVPRGLEHVRVEMHWEGKGVERAALNKFISLSRDHNLSKITTSNATHPAMEHVLETEGFTEISDGIGLEKEI